MTESILKITQYLKDVLFSYGKPRLPKSKTLGKKWGRLKIHNRIYEQRIYNYLSSLMESAPKIQDYNFRDQFMTEKGDLDIEKVLLKFQEFMKLQHSTQDENFLERNARLLASKVGSLFKTHY